MSVSRKDDQHNEDLVREIADSFGASMRARRVQRDADDADARGGASSGERLVITGDQRTSGEKHGE